MSLLLVILLAEFIVLNINDPVKSPYYYFDTPVPYFFIILVVPYYAATYKKYHKSVKQWL